MSGMAQPSTRRIGRPSKGERTRLVTRVPVELKAAVHRAAREHDMTENDYVSAILAAEIGLTDLVAPIQQEVLPQTA